MQKEGKGDQHFLLHCKSSRTQLPEHLFPKTLFYLCRYSEEMVKGGYYGKEGKLRRAGFTVHRDIN